MKFHDDETEMTDLESKILTGVAAVLMFGGIGLSIIGCILKLIPPLKQLAGIVMGIGLGMLALTFILSLHCKGKGGLGGVWLIFTFLSVVTFFIGAVSLIQGKTTAEVIAFTVIGGVVFLFLLWFKRKFLSY